MAIQVGAVCEKGPIRSSNQDALYAFPNASGATDSAEDLACFIMCDGMGGNTDTPFFTPMVDIIRKHIEDAIPYLFPPTDRVPDTTQVLEIIQAAFQKANQFLIDQHPRFQGAACVTAAVCTKSQMFLGHIGDTRAYKITEGRIQQLTQDHSYWDRLLSLTMLPDEPEEPPYRLVLYRALGAHETAEVDTLAYPISKGGWLLLCTDGLHKYVTDNLMLNTILNHPPQEAAERLVALALQNGSDDNISVIVARL